MDPYSKRILRAISLFVKSFILILSSLFSGTAIRKTILQFVLVRIAFMRLLHFIINHFNIVDNSNKKDYYLKPTAAIMVYIQANNNAIGDYTTLCSE